MAASSSAFWIAWLTPGVPDSLPAFVGSYFAFRPGPTSYTFGL